MIVVQFKQTFILPNDEPAQADSSGDPWIHAVFYEPVVVTSVSTQGGDGSDNWVTKYRIYYSTDDLQQNWQWFLDDNGNQKVGWKSSL